MRLAAGAALALALGATSIAVNQTLAVSELRGDLLASEIEASQLGDEAQGFLASLSEANDQVALLDLRIAESEAAIASVETQLADEQGRVGDLDAELRGQAILHRAALTALREEKEAAQELVAELSLAYSEEIATARASLILAAYSFACEWGAESVDVGRSAEFMTGDSAIREFGSSDKYKELSAIPEISTALSVAEAADTDFYEADRDGIGQEAADCWQARDAEVNAALYANQGVIEAAVLDAACTQGADDAYKRTSGYWATAVYRSWELTVGEGEAFDYINAVEDHFGSIEAFLQIPAETIQAESDRCDDVRDLTEPKYSGTWNVGDEIKPGIWKAYDEEDCYWARLAVNGDIRDNFFGDALRLTVNVRSSDGQFEISGCTFFYADP